MLIKGSALEHENVSRKVQDPLSIRNAVQIHGTLISALEFARDSVNQELNSSTDNPVVDFSNKRMVSSGGYYSSQLTLALETVSRAVSQVVVAQLARISKLVSEKHSGLPQYLARSGVLSNGFAPVLKVAEALVARIKLALSNVDHWPSINADGVEDVQNNAPLAAQTLIQALRNCERLCALELIIAARALDMRADIQCSDKVSQLYQSIREVVAESDQVCSIGGDVEVVASKIRTRSLPIPD